RGGPVEPIRGPGGSSTLAAHEAGAVALLSIQLGNIRGAEADKAAARLNELLADSDSYREKGYGITITLVMEVPNTIDLAAAVTGIGDASQVVYFNRMFISAISAPAIVQQAQADTGHAAYRANLAPGDPQQDDPNDWTLDQQI